MTNPVTETITEVLASQEYSGMKLEDINSGDCNYFANDVVIRLHEKGILDAYARWVCDAYPEFDNGYCHMVIWYQGKMYDCEVPDGVDHPSKLPFYQRATKFFEMCEIINMQTLDTM